MSEEEIIKILNSYTTDLYHSYKEGVILKAIKDLLDLYNKEKEKNKRIKDASLMVVGRRNGKEYAQKLVLEEYIHKDKIKQKIKELEEMRDDHADEIKRNLRFYSIYDSYNLQISELQDLLEEEEI